ncbi:hypothetical protein MKUB_22730 [Mycobacterium kubicae]|uniref:DUF2752 domain-containing protein n=1 Tax=Mycobacterium kubicae TaxID=120959 RepID=A0AAX1JHS8_9MYCO|nr:DUF2752 domain-containing protein [Mycobacterium kubicae]MCV7098802.1 DUF2752 domain-containing protein [Mycobacterium kubicae]ORW03428.1 hypothetical protein AWC13_02415 [Mycobacterium kubicae]QNI11866.1 DUF2752 domain-containing protein [Mycobacterium kubicae]QPI40091.1 DUF2752 domain-containing protein [Mycobacterium kubicae]GFG64783.1 hypothetical protein MKUB_22730 [Mycobacterium kubicae]
MEPEQASRPPGLRGHRGGAYAAAGSAVLLAGALGYVALVDPHNTNSVYPQCPFKAFTGWNCPACGGLRMMHDLLHGDLAASINDNIFLLVGLPLLAGWVITRRYRGRTALSIPAVVTVVVAMIAWTVVRNLPGFPLMPTISGG